MPRLHRELMRALLADIVGGRFAVGEMLPKEQDLVADWEVSRGVVREVIRALEERRVLAVKHGRGARVLPTAGWDVLDHDVLSALLAGPEADGLARELVEARMTLEVETACLAADRRSDRELSDIAAAFEAMSAATDSSARGAAEVTFHRALLRAAGNRPMSRMLNPFLDAMETAQAMFGRRSESVEEHERLLEAIRNRDPAAAGVAMEQHLLAAEGTFTTHPAPG